MALPLIIPALFAAGSAAANYAGNRAAERARDDALEAERIRQRQFDDQSFALADRSRQQFEGFGEQQEQRSDDLAAMFRETVDARPTAPAPEMPQSSNVAVSKRNAAAGEQAEARTADRGQSLADFRAFGDLFGDMSRGQNRIAQQVDQIGRFKRGSQSVLPMELDAAAERGAGMRTLGDVLGLGASVTMGPALAGPAAAGGLSRLFGGGK